MSNTLFNKVKETIYRYDLDIDDTYIRQIVIQLKPHFKNEFLSKLPTIKEIEDELANQPATSAYANGIADGAKKIIKQLQKL